MVIPVWLFAILVEVVVLFVFYVVIAEKRVGRLRDEYKGLQYDTEPSVEVIPKINGGEIVVFRNVDMSQKEMYAFKNDWVNSGREDVLLCLGRHSIRSLVLSDSKVE